MGGHDFHGEPNPFMEIKSVRSNQINQKITDISSDIAKYASNSKEPIFVCMNMSHGPNLELINGIESNLVSAGLRFHSFDGGFNKTLVKEPRLDEKYFTFDTKPDLEPHFDAPLIISRGLKQGDFDNIIDGLFIVFEPSSAALDGQKNIEGKLNIGTRWKDAENGEILRTHNSRVLNLKTNDGGNKELATLIATDESQRLFIIDLHETIPEHIWKGITIVRYAPLIREDHNNTISPKASDLRLGLRNRSLRNPPAGLKCDHPSCYGENGWECNGYDSQGNSVTYSWSDYGGWQQTHYDDDYD
jgi:hypothetical protein